jgi:polysaccharide export outer membrane protein
MRQPRISQHSIGRSFSFWSLGVSLTVLLVLLPTLAAKSQQPSAITPAGVAAETDVSNSRAQTNHSRYLIGIGDVLDIRVFGRPQLSRDAVRVEGSGAIRMPLLDGDIQATCRTVDELAADITTRYLKYVRRPQVEVFIREYNSQPVAVIGAVAQPGRFQLHRPVRLLEILSLVGGPSASAGRTVQITHADSLPTCAEDAITAKDGGAGLAPYNLKDVLAGRDEANPYMRPGDVISVLEAEQIFVVGNVIRPSSIPLKEPLTVSKAIAMSGGVLPYTKSDCVRIIRQSPGSTKKEIFVDLKAIDKQKAEDIALQANDIVDVPVSGGKRLLGSLVGSVVPAVTQMPVRVIP